MGSNPVVSNALILEVLNHNNYKHWRSRMKTYFLSEGLWEVIEAISREPTTAKLEDANEAECNNWTQKNAKALYAIQNSCGREMFSFISEIETAKSAWETLERVSKVRGYVLEKSVHNFEPFIPFRDSVRIGDWNKAKECLREVDVHSAVRAVDPRDGFGDDIALHVAARKGHVHVVKELVQLMTLEDLKMKNAEGFTAIHIATLKKRVQTVEVLGPLMGELKDSDGDTALHIAVHQETVDIVKVLVPSMRQEDLKIKNNNGYTALHLAVDKGNVPIVKELGPLMGEVRGHNGDTALHIAVEKGNVEIVKQLVLSMRREEDLAIKNNGGYAAFDLAIKKGNVPIVRELLKKYYGHGENKIVAKDDCDRYILFIKHVRNGDLDQAKDCLTELDDSYDAITRVNKHGDTSLHVAVKASHEHIVKALVSLLKGRQEKDLKLKTTEQDVEAFCSDVNLNNVDERVVMERAKYWVEQCEKKLSNILDVQNAEGSTSLHLAVLTLNEDIVKLLVPLMRLESFEVIDNDGYTALHRAVLKGNVNIVKELVPRMRQEGLEIKTAMGSNALHLAVWHRHMHIVKELVSWMTPEAMTVKNGRGYTALGYGLEACNDKDVMEMAKCMAEKNKEVFGINMPTGNWIPVVWACSVSNWKLGHYLYHFTPKEFLEANNGAQGAALLIFCLLEKKLDIALHLLRRYPKFAITESGNGARYPLVELAGMHSAFFSGTQLGFWQKLIYNCICLKSVNRNSQDISIHIQEDDQCNKMDLTSSVISLYRELVTGLRKILGIHRLHEMKSIHARIRDVLNCISELAKKDDLTSAEDDILKTSIFRAIEHGHIELVTTICKAHPKFVVSNKEISKNIFQFALECRQNQIYSLIYGLEKEERRNFGACYTKFPNNMLHLAGNLSPLSRFNRIRGAALQMQREIQWFKEVENIVPPEMHDILNSDGMTPRELFTKNHGKLKEEAENSMKGTATSCTVVGALIVTIMFSAAFTLPGGNNGSSGAPMFIAEKLFMVFIISDTLSLVSATTSVMLFLGILTSRYAEDDFLKDLPTKMMIGLFTLFLSIATMMIAFSCALIIMLEEKYSWAAIPSIFAASIPVASFIWLQFPLLVEIFWSTYGPGIFDRKVKRWV